VRILLILLLSFLAVSCGNKDYDLKEDERIEVQGDDFNYKSGKKGGVNSPLITYHFVKETSKMVTIREVIHLLNEEKMDGLIQIPKDKITSIKKSGRYYRKGESP